MQTTRFYPLNFFIIAAFTAVACAFQTTVWFQIFGTTPTPLFWLNIVLYLFLYRRSSEALISVYALMMLVNPFTVLPLSTLWVMMLFIFLVVNFFKKRVFWPGSRYFFLASISVSILFQASSLTVAAFFETQQLNWSLFYRLAEILLTPLVSIPTYYILEKWDHLSTEELLNEAKSSREQTEGVE